MRCVQVEDGDALWSTQKAKCGRVNESYGYLTRLFNPRKCIYAWEFESHANFLSKRN